MTRLEANLQILGLLATVSSNNPDLRFGQLLAKALDRHNQSGLFYIESVDLLALLREDIANGFLRET